MIVSQNKDFSWDLIFWDEVIYKHKFLYITIQFFIINTIF